MDRNIDVMRIGSMGAFLLCVWYCVGAVAQSQMEMNQSASESRKVVSEELATAIGLYRQRLKDEQLALFDQSQQAWEAYRQAACEYQSSGVSGGSVEPMVRSGCMEAFTRERLKYIQELSICKEGDLSCPAPRARTQK